MDRQEMASRFARFFLGFPGRLALPIGICAGLEIITRTVAGAVSRPKAQVEAVLSLLEKSTGFFIPSGCDIPPGTPPGNLEAFDQAVAEFGAEGRGL